MFRIVLAALPLLVAPAFIGCDSNTLAAPGVTLVVSTQTASGAPTPRLYIDAFVTPEPCGAEPLPHPFPSSDGLSLQDTQRAPEHDAELSPGFEEEGLLIQCANLALTVVNAGVFGELRDDIPADTIFAVPVSLRTKLSQPYERARIEVTLANY